MPAFAACDSRWRLRRRQKLDRFSLESLIRMVQRLGYTVTISTERRRFDFRSTRGLTRNRGD